MQKYIPRNASYVVMKCLIVCKMYRQFLPAVELQSHSEDGPYRLMCDHFLFDFSTNICSLASYTGPSPVP